MKKLFVDLLLPSIITAIFVLLMSASYKADSLITNSRNEYLSAMSENTKIASTTLIIDAGHGGADGGALSISGEKESILNLKISNKTELFAAFFGVSTITTRDSEEINYNDSAITIHDKKIDDSNRRVNIINSVDDAVLISIHQNFYNESSVSGAQIFYKACADSKALSENINTFFKHFASKVRTPCQISDSIYLFKKINCPAVLVECGFISNFNENLQLNENNYQNKIAMAIISGYLQYENRLYNTVGGIYES